MVTPRIIKRISTYALPFPEVLPTDAASLDRLKKERLEALKERELGIRERIDASVLHVGRAGKELDIIKARIRAITKTKTNDEIDELIRGDNSIESHWGNVVKRYTMVAQDARELHGIKADFPKIKKELGLIQAHEKTLQKQ